MKEIKLINSEDIQSGHFLLSIEDKEPMGLSMIFSITAPSKIRLSGGIINVLSIDFPYAVCIYYQNRKEDGRDVVVGDRILIDLRLYDFKKASIDILESFFGSVDLEEIQAYKEMESIESGLIEDGNEILRDFLSKTEDIT